MTKKCPNCSNKITLVNVVEVNQRVSRFDLDNMIPMPGERDTTTYKISCQNCMHSLGSNLEEIWKTLPDLQETDETSTKRMRLVTMDTKTVSAANAISDNLEWRFQNNEAVSILSDADTQALIDYVSQYHDMLYERIDNDGSYADRSDAKAVNHMADLLEQVRPDEPRGRIDLERIT